MCTIQLKRERRFGYSARRIHIYINGVQEYSVKNGDTYTHILPPGKHKISFFLGKNLLSDIVLAIEEETDSSNVIFWITSAGQIEIVLSNNNIAHSITQKSAHTGGWYIFLGIIIALFVLFLLGIRITPVIYLLPIN